MLMSSQFDLTSWDLNASIESEVFQLQINMNEALQEVNQRPSSSDGNTASGALQLESGTVSTSIRDTTSPRINMTKEEVSAAEAVAAMASKEVTDTSSNGGLSSNASQQGDGSGSSTSSENSAGNKRDRSETEGEQSATQVPQSSSSAAAVASTKRESLTHEYASTEKQREKIARLDGHSAASSISW